MQSTRLDTTFEVLDSSLAHSPGELFSYKNSGSLHDFEV